MPFAQLFKVYTEGDQLHSLNTDRPVMSPFCVVVLELPLGLL